MIYYTLMQTQNQVQIYCCLTLTNLYLILVLGSCIMNDSIRNYNGSSMNKLMELFLFCTWIVGIVLAKGFWSTVIAVLIPLWAWYLVAERLLQYYGVI